MMLIFAAEEGAYQLLDGATTSAFLHKASVPRARDPKHPLCGGIPPYATRYASPPREMEPKNIYVYTIILILSSS